LEKIQTSEQQNLFVWLICDMAEIVKITGINTVIRNLTKAKKNIATGVGRGLKKGGLHLKRKSDEIVPVDWGDLKGSGFCRNVGGTGFDTDIVVGYGSEACNYAIFVHEDLNAAHGKAFNIKYAKEILGKELSVNDALSEGDMIDTIAITKGKGFQGHIKRWGVKLLTHKNSKHRRMIGTAGSWHPNWIQSTVPQAGQMGYHQRTEFNKRVLKIGENGEEITPSGGFPNYGVVRNSYVLLHGSIPGPTKRLISMRDAIRYQRGVKVEKPEISYISTTSKQGV